TDSVTDASLMCLIAAITLRKPPRRAPSKSLSLAASVPSGFGFVISDSATKILPAQILVLSVRSLELPLGSCPAIIEINQKSPQMNKENTAEIWVAVLHYQVAE